MKNRILNLGILAHVDAGKTTLTESFLYHGNVIRSMGTVDRGTTTTDSMELEKARGITIRASTVSFMIDDVKINLIDTPGHADFIGEVERSLRVLDGVVLVISAVEGVQPQTRILFRHLERMRIPTLIFINKIDRIGADYERTCRQIREQLSPRLVLMQDVLPEEKCWKIRERMLNEEVLSQQIIGYSEKLLEKYLEEIPISEEEVFGSMQFRVQKGRLYPVYVGSALRDIGVVELMKAIITWLPRRDSTRDKKKELSAYIYKVEFDEKGRKKAYFRVFSGELSSKMRISIAERKEEFVVNSLCKVCDGKQEKASVITEGDIGILMDVPEICCGDFLGKQWKQKGLIAWGEPMLQIEVHSKTPGERFALLNGLKKLECEDPLLRINIDPETKEIHVSMFGKLQIEILASMLRDRFGLDVTFSGIRTICRLKPKHAISEAIRIREPGNLHYAGIEFLIQPLEAGMGNQYETKVSFGDLKETFQNGAREGALIALESAMSEKFVDTKITFTDMDFDSVCGTPADYRRLAQEVFIKAIEKVGTDTMEPIMTYQLTAPLAHEKKVVGELRKMMASIETMEFGSEELVIKGQVPYDTAKEFQIDLSMLTGGKGIFEMEFLEYRIKERN